MVKKVEKYLVLEKKDVEKILSDFLGREVKLSEVEFVLEDFIPDDSEPDEVYNTKDEYLGNLFCEVKIDGESICDDEGRCPLDEYLPEQALVSVKDIFAFDIDEFKSFRRKLADPMW